MPLRYLVVGDLHLDVKAPSQKRIDNYEEACFDKLDQLIQMVGNDACELIVVTGDWFHRKSPAAVPHRLVKRTLDWLNECAKKHIYVLTVAGNHDVQYADFSEQSRSKQPFGVLCSAAYNLIDLSVRDQYSTGGYVFTGSSYKRPVKVLDELVEDTTQFASILDKTLLPTGPGYYDISKHIHVCHASVVDKPPSWKPYTLVEDVFRATVADLIHCGHIHDYIGAIAGTNSLGKPCVFTNLGSMTRGALTEESIERQPMALLVELDVALRPEVSIQKRLFDYRPAEEIYNIASYRQEKTKVATANAWAQQLRREFGQAEIEADESFEDLITQSGALDHRTRELARGILDEVGE